MSDYESLEKAQKKSFEEQQNQKGYEVERSLDDVLKRHIVVNGHSIKDVISELPEGSYFWDLGHGKGKVLKDAQKLNSKVKILGVSSFQYLPSELEKDEFMKYLITDPVKILERVPDKRPLLITSTEAMIYALPHPADLLIKTISTLLPGGYAFMNNLPVRFMHKDEPIQLVFGGKSSLLHQFEEHGIKSNLAQLHEFDGGFCYIPILAIQKGPEDNLDIPYDIYLKEMNDKKYLVVDFTLES